MAEIKPSVLINPEPGSAGVSVGYDSKLYVYPGTKFELHCIFPRRFGTPRWVAEIKRGITMEVSDNMHKLLVMRRQLCTGHDIRDHFRNILPDLMIPGLMPLSSWSHRRLLSGLVAVVKWMMVNS